MDLKELKKLIEEQIQVSRSEKNKLVEDEFSTTVKKKRPKDLEDTQGKIEKTEIDAINADNSDVDNSDVFAPMGSGPNQPTVTHRKHKPDTFKQLNDEVPKSMYHTSTHFYNLVMGPLLILLQNNKNNPLTDKLSFQIEKIVVDARNKIAQEIQEKYPGQVNMISLAEDK